MPTDEQDYAGHVTPDEAVDFQIKVLRAHVVADQQLLRLDVTLTNTSAGPLSLDHSTQPLRMGLLLKQDGKTIHEQRLPAPEITLLPGEALDISTEEKIPESQPGEIDLLVSLVREGVQWFFLDDPTRASHTKIRLQDEYAAKRSFWRNYTPSEETLADKRVPLLLEMARLFDFSKQAKALLSRGRTLAPSQGLATMDRHMSARAEKISKSSGLPLDRRLEYFLHYTKRIKPDRLDTVTLGHVIETLADIAKITAGQPTHNTTPLCADLRSILHRDISDGWVFDYPMTSVMLYLMRTRNYTETASNPTEVAYWLINEVLEPESLPLGLLPTSLVGFMGDTLNERHYLLLSRFYHEIYTRQNYGRQYDRADCGRAAFSFDMLMRYVDNPVMGAFLGNDITRFWGEPLGKDGPSPLAVMLWAYTDTPISLDQVDDPFSNIKIQDWFETAIRVRHPALSKLVPVTEWSRRPMGTPFAPPDLKRITLVGLPKSQTGLGQNTRMFHNVLKDLDVTVDLYDFEQRDFLQKAPGPASAGATLFAINAEHVPAIAVEGRNVGLISNQMIGFFLWEYSKLSEQQVLGVEMMDRIWVPSEFVRDAIATVTDRPIQIIPKAIHVPQDLAPRSEQDPEALTFMTSFDSHSGTERKNPIAGVRAFQDAFPIARYPRMSYVIKTTELFSEHWGDPSGQLAEMRKRAAADHRIQIISSRMEYDQYLALIRSADCIVSAHRSEGFGYLMAHALAAGVPVISTDYSGNTEFCTPATSYPVPYRLKPVTKDEMFLFVEGATWADPDHGALVQAMRDVQGDLTEANHRAMIGQTLIETKYSATRVQNVLMHELSDIGLL